MEIISYLNGVTNGIIPLAILINFVLLLLCIAVNVKSFARVLSGISWKIWLLLIAVFSIALMLRLHTYHRHILFIDEFLYMEAGKNLLLHHTQFDFPESIGWPFLLSVFFAVFGVDNHVAMYASVFSGALSVFAVFLLVYAISNNANQGIFSALIFALMPVNIMWSGTASQSTTSQFLIITTMFFCLLYYKNRTLPLLLLACAGLSFASQFRQESYFYPLLFISGFFIYGIGISKKRVLGFLVPFLLLMILSSPNLLNILDNTLPVNWIESDTRGAQTGANWSFSNFISNFSEYGPHIISGKYHPVIYSLLFIAGGIFMAKNRRKEFLFLAVWLVGLIAIYFTSWFQTLGGKSRFFMFLVPVTIIFASYGIICIYQLLASRLSKAAAGAIVAVLTAVLSVTFVPYITSYSDNYSDDVHFLTTSVIERAEIDVPPNCRIVANIPVILKSTTELNVVDTETFLDSGTYRDEIGDENKCALFYEDVFCDRWDWGDSFGKCRFFFNRFRLEPFLSYSHGDAVFKFWKITDEIEYSPDEEFRIVRSIPESGGKGIVRNPSEYVFHFNQPVDRDFMKREFFDFGEVYFSGDYSAGNNVLIFRVKCYDSYLEKNRNYRITLSERIRSADGAYMTPFELVFQAGGKVDPDGPPEISPEDEGYGEKCR